MQRRDALRGLRRPFDGARVHRRDRKLGETLRGFATARILRGEFGRENAVAVLDGLGVEIDTQEQGIGQALMSELVRTLRNMGVQSLQSQAEWTNGTLLRFFAGSGFLLAPRFALERSVVEPLAEPTEDI